MQESSPLSATASPNARVEAINTQIRLIARSADHLAVLEPGGPAPPPTPQQMAESQHDRRREQGGADPSPWMPAARTSDANRSASSRRLGSTQAVAGRIDSSPCRTSASHGSDSSSARPGDLHRLHVEARIEERARQCGRRG